MRWLQPRPDGGAGTTGASSSDLLDRLSEPFSNREAPGTGCRGAGGSADGATPVGRPELGAAMGFPHRMRLGRQEATALRPPARSFRAGAHTTCNSRRRANPRPPQRSVTGCAVTVPYPDHRGRPRERREAVAIEVGISLEGHGAPAPSGARSRIRTRCGFVRGRTQTER